MGIDGRMGIDAGKQIRPGDIVTVMSKGQRDVQYFFFVADDRNPEPVLFDPEAIP